MEKKAVIRLQEDLINKGFGDLQIRKISKTPESYSYHLSFVHQSGEKAQMIFGSTFQRLAEIMNRYQITGWYSMEDNRFTLVW